MKCESCGVVMIEHRATEEAPYAYRESGLTDVFLTGIRLRKCPRCGGQSAIIPRIDELHNLMAETLIKKPIALKGEEIRFLRKHAVFPAKEFSALLGIDAAHLSRVENGHVALGAQSDRLVRAFSLVTNKGGEMARDVLLEVARLLAQKRRRVVKQHPTFSLSKEGWKAAA